MALLGLLLLITGVIMNIQVLRRGRSLGFEADRIVRMPPWLVSVALIVVGIALLIVGGH